MSRSKPVALVVDRETDDARALMAFLRVHDLEAIGARDAEPAYNVIAARSPGCLRLGLRIAGRAGSRSGSREPGRGAGAATPPRSR